MKETIIDSNVLIDVLLRGENWFDRCVPDPAARQVFYSNIMRGSVPPYHASTSDRLIEMPPGGADMARAA